MVHSPLFRQIVALGSLALLGALLSNSLAGPARRLRWTGRPLEREAGPAPAASLAPAVPPAPSSPPEAVAPSQPAPTPGPLRPPAARAPAAAPSEPPIPSALAPRDRFPADPEHPMREIESETAFELHTLGALFLDARRSSAFPEGHVRGAWSLPVWEDGLEESLVRFEAAARPAAKDPLVIYCEGGGCEDSHLLAQRLFRLGYRNLVIYREGYPDWVRRGWPVSKGNGR